LLSVLTFYAEGVQAGSFANNLLSFGDPADYWSTLIQADPPAALVKSDIYLGETSSELALYPLPGVDGKSFIILDGWVWALTATDISQQAGALAWLEWMMRIENQTEFTEPLRRLPSQRRALRIWSDRDYATTVEPWFAQGVVLPLESRNNPAAEQLQKALEAVLDGIPAEDAVRDALAALETTN
jgi:ABC-type glycerol-3-phosphate transport system substrate-binding protein